MLDMHLRREAGDTEDVSVHVHTCTYVHVHVHIRVHCTSRQWPCFVKNTGTRSPCIMHTHVPGTCMCTGTLEVLIDKVKYIRVFTCNCAFKDENCHFIGTRT